MSLVFSQMLCLTVHLKTRSRRRIASRHASESQKFFCVLLLAPPPLLSLLHRLDTGGMRISSSLSRRPCGSRCSFAYKKKTARSIAHVAPPPPPPPPPSVFSPSQTDEILNLFPVSLLFAGPLRAGHPSATASGLLPRDVSFLKHPRIHAR